MSEIRVDTISEKTTGSGTTVSNLVNPNRSFRNMLINGDMSIAQRGTSEASVTAGGYYNIDRWRTDVITAGTWTISQSTDVPAGQGFFNSQKWDCTTADSSLAASDRAFFEQRIEDQNCVYLNKGTSSALSTTASFWVKSNKTGTYICEIYDSQNSRHISKSYTIDAADTWEKKTITFAGDTTGAFANDNGIGLMIRFWLAAGSTYNSGTLATSWQANDAADRAVGNVNLADSTSNEWYITGVQFEAGGTATDYEHLPHDVQFHRCCRYFYRIAAGNNQRIGDGALYSANQAYFPVFLPNKLRAGGTLTGVGGSGYFLFYRSDFGDYFDEVTLWDTRDNLAYLRSIAGTISGTAGQAGMVQTSNASAVLDISAEF